MKFTEFLGTRWVTWTAMLAVTLLASSLQAQTKSVKAQVRAIRGTAVYSAPNLSPQPLKVGMALPAGAKIETGVDSTVDLFLGPNAGVLRVSPESSLSLNKLSKTETGADTVVEVQLDLPKGTILGNVNKLSAASKYEIKLPNGVAGIRGTRFRASATSFILLLDGSLVFVHVPPGRQPKPYTMKAPPAVYFSPLEGVKPAPPELIRNFEIALDEIDQIIKPGDAPNPRRELIKPVISPGIGQGE